MIDVTQHTPTQHSHLIQINIQSIWGTEAGNFLSDKIVGSESFNIKMRCMLPVVKSFNKISHLGF